VDPDPGSMTLWIRIQNLGKKNEEKKALFLNFLNIYINCFQIFLCGSVLDLDLKICVSGLRKNAGSGLNQSVSTTLK
jgi:hypothetical protein